MFSFSCRLAVVHLVAAALLAFAGTAHAGPGEPDCDGPAPAAAPGEPEWEQREADNVSGASQRSTDPSATPLYNAAATRLQGERGGAVGEAPFRDPAPLAGIRFRYEPISFQ